MCILRVVHSECLVIGVKNMRMRFSADLACGLSLLTGRQLVAFADLVAGNTRRKVTVLLVKSAYKAFDREYHPDETQHMEARNLNHGQS